MYYDQQRQLLQGYLKGTAGTFRAPPEPRLPVFHPHRPPNEHHEVLGATPNCAVPDTKSDSLLNTPQRTCGAPPIGTTHTPAAVHHARWEQHPLVPTPMRWPHNLQAPLSWLAGRHPLVANRQQLTHNPITPHFSSNSSRNSSPISLRSFLTSAVTIRVNNHPVLDTSLHGMLEDGRNLGAQQTTNSKQSRPAYVEDL